MKDGSTPANSRNQESDPGQGRPTGANRRRVDADRGSVASRVLALGALIAVAVLVAVVLVGGDSGHQYKLMFQTGGQLVKGNQVLIGGAPVGSVDDIRLTKDNQAEVKISVDQALHEGSTAVIRATSLSGVANHYVSISPGPNNADELSDGTRLTGASTTTPVDLDQLFDAFSGRARRGLRQVVQGFDDWYVGKGPQANKTYKYFGPALSSTTRVLRELNRDQGVLTRFVVDTSRVFTAVGERSDDLSGLISNSNQALGAIASENRAFDRALSVFPGTLRQANTTFVNLRAALDDVDPLVNTSKVATRDLAPFLRRAQPVLHRAVPVFTDLHLVVDRPGNYNDLGEAVEAIPKVQRKASNAFPAAVAASEDSMPFISFARPYTPDLLSAFTNLGQVTGFYDANGHYARVQPANTNIFERDLSGTLVPIPPEEQFSDLEFGIFQRCPGGSTQAIAGSNPFTDNGNLDGACDPGDVPPGP